MNDKVIITIDREFGSGGHEGWANSKTFELAGITKDTPDPVPGLHYFTRDEEGNPMESCPHSKQHLWIDLGIELDEYDILRREEPQG
jgi:hypothetical protein